MAIAQSLTAFRTSLSQCDNLIANAHSSATSGAHYFPLIDREQITVAAFLNMFIAWEEFIEATICGFMLGAPTINGTQPTRFVSPTNKEHSLKMVIHTNRYFDYANQDSVKKLAKLYFDNGYPFDPPISSLSQELTQLKTIRNACAHMSSTTKTAFETIAMQVLGAPQPGISVYQLLTAIIPNSKPSVTVFASYKEKLLTAAQIIAEG
ncbi:hypothetical protein H9643_08275 [Ochrobactrum sp. Sa2BUA5]|nr:hypothetical protein [Ochrobactrum gallinarum]